MGFQAGEHTWGDILTFAGVPKADHEALLWCGTAFPFSSVKHTWHQLQHVIRHRQCLDKPEGCGMKPRCGCVR